MLALILLITSFPGFGSTRATEGESKKEEVVESIEDSPDKVDMDRQSSGPEDNTFVSLEESKDKEEEKPAEELAEEKDVPEDQPANPVDENDDLEVDNKQVNEVQEEKQKDVTTTEEKDTDTAKDLEEASKEKQVFDKSQELINTTVSAKIYTDENYITEADKGEIKLSGLMPAKSVVKAYPVDIQLDDETQELLLAYDITIFDQDGNVYEPSKNNPIKVDIKDEKIEENKEVEVYHLEDENSKKEKVAEVKKVKDTVTFEAESFSIYCVISTPTHTYKFYDTNGNLINSPNATQIIKGSEEILEPEAPKIEGKKFIGWYYGQIKLEFVNGKIKPLEVPSSATNGKEFRIEPKYQDAVYVHFYYNSKMIATKEVAYGSLTNGNNVPYILNDGRAFSHWSETEGGQAFNFSTPITKETNLYLVDVVAYKVEFHTQGGNSILPSYVKDGQTIPKPLNPVRQGYTFLYWSTSPNGLEYNFSNPVKSNMDLYAVWKSGTSPYTIVYWQENAEDNGYTFYESVNKTGETGSLIYYDESKSYTGFYYYNADVNKVITPDGNTVLNVYFKRNVWTLKIMKNPRGTLSWREVATIKYKYGQSTAPTYDKALNDNQYYLMYIERWSPISYSEAPKMPDSNLDLYLRYSGQYKYVTKYVDEKNVSINKDYIFFGQPYLQYTEEDGIEIPGFTVRPKSDWDPFTYMKDLGYYLGTIKYIRNNNYSITFNTYNQNNEVKTASSIPYDSDISKKDISGLISGVSKKVVNGQVYYFDAWYDNSAFAGSPFSFTGKKMPYNNMILYAKWIPEKYTVKFHSDTNEQSSIFSTYKVDPKSTVNYIDPPVKNKEFIGWYWYLGGTFTKFDFNTPITSNIDLYPVWKDQISSVIYDANGGTGTQTDNNRYSSGVSAIVKEPGNISRAGYDFLGWNTAKDGSGKKYLPNDSLLIEDSNITLYAIWGLEKANTKVVYKPGIAGTGEDVVVENLINATITLPKAPQSEDPALYTFIGWQAADGKIYEPGAKFIIDEKNEASDNIFTAYWSKKVTAEKVWVDGPDKHPEVTLVLSGLDKQQNLKVYKDCNDTVGKDYNFSPKEVKLPLTVDDKETWSNEWIIDPQKVDENTIAVDEPTVPENYEKTVEGMTVTNKYVPPKNDVQATKDWQGEDPAERPTIWFKLLRQVGENGKKEAMPEAKIIEIANGGTSVTWNDIEQTDKKGNPYIFTVQEVDQDGNDYLPAGYSKIEEGLSVKNTYYPYDPTNITSLRFEKTWLKPKGMVSSVDGLPELTVKVVAKGTESPAYATYTFKPGEYQEVTIDGVTYYKAYKEWKDLPLYVNGNLMDYTVIEDDLLEYKEEFTSETPSSIQDLKYFGSNDITSWELKNPTFIITRTTKNGPFVIWTLNHLPEKDRQDFINNVFSFDGSYETPLDDLDRHINKKNGGNLSRSNIVWIEGAQVSKDVINDGTTKGLIEINITFDEISREINNSTLNFYGENTWTHFAYGTYSSKSVFYKNTLKTVAVDVKKLVEGNVKDPNDEFSFEYSIFKDGEAARDSGYFNLKDSRDFANTQGQNIIVPEGYSIKIKETDNKGFETVSKSDISSNESGQEYTILSAEIDKKIQENLDSGQNNKITVTFTNTKNINVPTGVYDNSKPYAVFFGISLLAVIVYVFNRKRKSLDI